MMLTLWGWELLIYLFIKFIKYILILIERIFKWFMNLLFELKRF